MTVAQYTVTGMSCANCERHIRAEVEQIAGLEHVEVSHQSGILTVTAQAIDDSTVLAAVAEAGYAAERAA